MLNFTYELPGRDGRAERATGPRLPDGPVGTAGIVVLGVALVSVAIAAIGPAIVLPVVISWSGAAAFVDARTGRIPDRLVVAAALTLAALVLHDLVVGDVGVLPPLIAGAALLGGPLAALHLVAPSGLGFGDVKLGTVLGATVAVVDPRAAVAALCLASGSALITGALTRRATVAFGPPLVIGALGAIAGALLLGGGVAPWR